MEEKNRGASQGLEGNEPALRASHELPRILAWLKRGQITATDLLPWGTNYTFVVAVRHEGRDGLAVYKPRRGEAPLWDFPEGTLYRREFAAFVLSSSIGWPSIPPTVLRDGPAGVGSLQAYVDADPEANYFTFGRSHVDDVQRIALFDCIVNNADRKAGHCLLGKEGKVWAIDHGLTFNAQPKLRTVIWDFAAEPIPSELLADLATLLDRLEPASRLARRLEHLLSVSEVRALRNRTRQLLEHGRFPSPGSARSIPWPPI